jgi:predicted RNA-binding Zn-ribbon protein involved in translation (DUF1610 family)
MEPLYSVFFKCPECYHQIEQQAKAIDNAIAAFYEESVPRPVANSILGNTVYCPNCGDRFTVAIDTNAPTVPLFLRK